MGRFTGDSLYRLNRLEFAIHQHIKKKNASDNRSYIYQYNK